MRLSQTIFYHFYLYVLHIKRFIPLRELPQSIPQARIRLEPKIRLQRTGVRISDRHIPRLHRNQLLMGIKIIILRQHSCTDQLLLQDVHKLQQILRLAVSDIVNRIRRNRQTILAISLLRRCLHHTLYPFHDIIHISKISLAVSIIKDLDLLPGTQLIGKSKICHVRSSRRSVNRKETKTRRWNIIKLAVRMR